MCTSSLYGQLTSFCRVGLRMSFIRQLIASLTLLFTFMFYCPDCCHDHDSVIPCCRRSEAQNRAVVLEMIGDLPEADSKPPTNMLFIAKLNQVTTEEDLETIFGRFGNITSCDIIKDKKTGDSLCYAFLGYDNDASCETAYEKMNNVLIDDRRIKVDDPADFVALHADSADIML